MCFVSVTTGLHQRVHVLPTPEACGQQTKCIPCSLVCNEMTLCNTSLSLLHVSYWRAGASQPSCTTGTIFLYKIMFLCRRRYTYRKCLYVTLNLRICMQYFKTYPLNELCRAFTVFVSLVFVPTASATSQHNTLQQVGIRIKTALR